MQRGSKEKPVAISVSHGASLFFERASACEVLSFIYLCFHVECPAGAARKYAESCTQLQGAYKTEQVFFFFFFCHIFIISLTDLTKLGMNVYLRGWSKAGKLVPGAKGSKKKCVSLIRISYFLTVLLHLGSEVCETSSLSLGLSKISSGLCLSFPKLHRACAWRRHAFGPFMIKYQGTPLDILLAQQDG